ncbi:uncharacterized protein C1orf109 homolog isoform X1 [Ochotona curzoniae]|uniref:uncharacterized protein C1orf109 homolog isoform X1 n=1 Tax=Ochotona curzoniae TaxID=130825 RepID=UPI001B35009E|nr:uncharacterized protein C1orf109 homolog isoform X1 [Ochotona curzoniae]
MAADRSLLAVREALKKCFPAVREQQGSWQDAVRDCQPLLASLSNLAEQLRAAQSLRLDQVPALRAFPDLQERLRRKQLEAGDAVLEQLGDRLAALLKVRDAVSSHVEQVFEVYGQQANTLDLDAVLQPSAASPSVADMLEWLQDIDRHFRTSKVPEEESPPLLHPMGRLGEHPGAAQGLGPDLRRRASRPRSGYPVESRLLPGRVRKPRVSGG